MRNHGTKFAVVGMASGLLLASACSLDDSPEQGIETKGESAQSSPGGSAVESLTLSGPRYGRGRMYEKNWDAIDASPDGASTGAGGSAGATGEDAGAAGGSAGAGGTGGAPEAGGSSGAGASGGSAGTAGAAQGTGGSSGSASGTGGSAGAGTAGSAGSAPGCVTLPKPVPGASGKSIVVALNGNDSTGDGSFGKPVRTLKRACAMAQPGDAVEVRGGTYNTAGETCAAKGTVDHPVHLRPYAAEKVIFDATGHSLGKSVSVIELAGASHVVIDGFEVANSSGRGVFAYECVGVTMRNLRVHDTGYRGIGGTGDDLVFENNEVWNACEANAYGAMGTGGWPAAIATYARANGTPSKNVVIRNNHVHDSWGECVIALFADGMTVEGNQIHDCYSVSLYVDNSRNVRLERNQIWVTSSKYNKKGYPANGIMFSTESYGSGEPQLRIENLLIANNVITGTNKGVSYWHGSSTASYNTWLNVSILHNVVRDTTGPSLSFESTGGAPAASGGVLANNVVWAGTGGSALEVGNPGAWQISNNVWPSGKPAADKSTTAIATNPGMAAPVDASEPEGFRLTAGSACKGKGAASPLVPRDFWCAARSASAPSIGVHEP